jgi:hypothetical protein
MSAKSAIEIGKRLVELCNADQSSQAVDELYDEKIVSIEAQGSEQMPARMEGIQAIKRKHDWWYANHEVHASKALGPFCGHRDDRFAVLLEMDVTFKPSRQRTRMQEVALYTVSGGKIVQEEFLYPTS